MSATGEQQGSEQYRRHGSHPPVLPLSPLTPARSVVRANRRRRPSARVLVSVGLPNEIYVWRNSDKRIRRRTAHRLDTGTATARGRQRGERGSVKEASVGQA